MAFEDPVITSTSVLEQQRKALEQFDAQLEPLGLTKEQIERQTLPELEGSLERINDAMKHPESFGIIKLKMIAGTGLVITSAQSEAHFEIGIMPVLLERKKFILERIRELKGEQNVESLRGIVEEMHESEVRVKLEKGIEELKNQSETLMRQTQEVEQARLQEERISHEKIARLEMEMKERRARIWQAFLEKESVATIIGSFLLIVLTICMIIAMFTSVQSTEILNNAFLLILGYFFGQTVGRSMSTSGNKPPEGKG